MSGRTANGALSLRRVDRETVLRRHSFQNRLQSGRESGAGIERMMRRITICGFSLIFSSAVVFAQTLPKTMKAVVAHEYGGPEVLKLEDVPVSEPKENEILARVIASGVNPADPLILNGKYAKEFGTHLPLVLGYDMAGIVVKAGAKVTKLKLGDPVYAYLLWGGGWAEYCISNEGESAMKPKSLSFVEASAGPLAALTAWQAFDLGKLQSGQTVLIHGGSGGVGSFAIQIAKARGARVIAT